MYDHEFYLRSSTGSLQLGVSIPCENAQQFTVATLTQWLENNGYTTPTSGYRSITLSWTDSTLTNFSKIRSLYASGGGLRASWHDTAGTVQLTILSEVTEYSTIRPLFNSPLPLMDISRPWSWPANTEVDLGTYDGVHLYGILKAGTTTVTTARGSMYYVDITVTNGTVWKASLVGSDDLWCSPDLASIRIYSPVLKSTATSYTFWAVYTKA
jgi:hypothetical protein